LGVLRVYFWLPEALWMILLHLMTRSGHHARRLRWLPPWFDQVIHLPLPFLEEFIARAYRDDPQAAQETIMYLSNSTTLTRVAARCMVRVAFDTCNRARALKEIADLADELAWIPSPLPETISPLLSRVIEVSQSARAAQYARSGLARAAHLRPGARALADIRKAATLSDRRDDRDYGALAEAWSALFERAIAEAEEQARREGQIPQAYVAGPPLHPSTSVNLLRGRADLFRELEGLLLAPARPVLLLYGGRRAGKTSFLNFLPRTLGGNVLPLLVDGQELAAVETQQGIARRLAGAMSRSARESRNQTLPRWDDERMSRDPFDALLDWFDTIERETQRETVLLCLDEFERLDEIVQKSGNHAALHFLRHVIQHRLRWSVLLSGSHLLEELPAYWSDFLINTRALRVSYLSPTDTRNLIEHPTPDFPSIYTREAVDEIAGLTSGQPYLTQLICYELVEWLNLNREERRQITRDDARNILPIVFERGHQYFSEFWNLTLDEAGRDLVRALIVNPGRPLSDEQRQTAQRLERKEILRRQHDCLPEYEFQVPLLRLYVETIITGEIDEE